jgi:hypothetical protein
LTNDEIAVAKGHRYYTIVMVLESGNPIFVEDENDKDAFYDSIGFPAVGARTSMPWQWACRHFIRKHS